MGQPADSHLSGRGEITLDALRLLKYHLWPGNVRELKNVVQKALLMAGGYVVDSKFVRRALGETSLTPQLASSSLQAYVTRLLESTEQDSRSNVEATLTEWAERELYRQAFKVANQDLTKIVKWLGVSRPTVRERLIRYGLLGSTSPNPTNQESNDEGSGH